MHVVSIVGVMEFNLLWISLVSKSHVLYVPISFFTLESS